MNECFMEIGFEAELNTKENPELFELAEELCNEYQSTRATAITELRKMIFDREECFPFRTDDEFLLRFLRARNFIVPKAHKLLVRYCDFREQHRNLYDGVDLWGLGRVNKAYGGTMFDHPDTGRVSLFQFGMWDPNEFSIEELVRAGLAITEIGVRQPKLQVLGGTVIVDLEGISLRHVAALTPTVAYQMVCLMGLVRYCDFREQHRNLYDGVDLWGLGRVNKAYGGTMFDHPDTGRVSLFQFGMWDPNEFSIEELVRAGLAITEIGVRQPKLQVLGGTVIVDLEGISLRHVAALTPTVAYQMVCLMGLAMPVRLRSCHLVNYSWILNTFFYLFKRFIPQSAWGSIHFHGYDLKSLQQHISLECLPPKYGGTCKTTASFGVWLKKIKKYRDEQFDKEMKNLGYVIK